LPWPGFTPAPLEGWIVLSERWRAIGEGKNIPKEEKELRDELHFDIVSA
jgi:hypothetical protein